MKKLLLIIPLFILSTQVYAQLTGRILDETGTPVRYANVILLQGKPVTKGVLSDSIGNFIIPLPPAGAYMVSVTSIGYLELKKPVDISDTVSSLGIIVLKADPKNLKNV